ncbi:hypothetical protein [Denitratimonas tolerans]|uniref:Predicted pPIWI-associating nuclease domain-containing protein n=1 Tax=Denitratimonas tolerans TaxID=1338420 RepID=A0AAW9R4E1_9GAMM
MRDIERNRRERVRKINAAINNYNAAVRTYNNRVRANQQRLKNELARLQSRSSTQRVVTYRTSVVRLTESYQRLETTEQTRHLSNEENHFYDLSEREAANSVSLLNALDEDQEAPDDSSDASGLQATTITDEISSLSEDLDSRWRGALFSLNPKNPEAARHFCTSVREVFNGIIELSAPDDEVEAAMPGCERTSQGTVTRRSKMAYRLRAKGIVNTELEAFADENINNVLALIRELNGGTHGLSGALSLTALYQVKKRVEDSILFLCQIAA